MFPCKNNFLTFPTLVVKNIAIFTNCKIVGSSNITIHLMGFQLLRRSSRLMSCLYG